MDGDWFGLAASAAGGGVFGVLGTALGRIAGYFEQRQEQAFEEKRWAHDLALKQLVQETQSKADAAKRDMVQLQGQWDGLRASHAADAAIPDSYPIVHAIRALTRPALTLLLWVITALIFFNVREDQQQKIVETSVFAATAATLWWFGDRTGPASRKTMMN